MIKGWYQRLIESKEYVAIPKHRMHDGWNLAKVNEYNVQQVLYALDNFGYLTGWISSGSKDEIKNKNAQSEQLDSKDTIKKLLCVAINISLGVCAYLWNR